MTRLVSAAEMISTAVRVDDRHRALLMLLSGFWAAEGTAVLEIAEGEQQDHVALGTWRIKHEGNGQATLSLDFPDSADVDPELEASLLEALMDSGEAARWFVEAVQS